MELYHRPTCIRAARSRVGVLSRSPVCRLETLASLSLQGGRRPVKSVLVIQSRSASIPARRSRSRGIVPVRPPYLLVRIRRSTHSIVSCEEPGVGVTVSVVWTGSPSMPWAGLSGVRTPMIAVVPASVRVSFKRLSRFVRGRDCVRCIRCAESSIRTTGSSPCSRCASRERKRRSSLKASNMSG